MASLNSTRGQGVEAVAFDHGGVDFFRGKENVLERALDGGGAGAG